MDIYAAGVRPGMTMSGYPALRAYGTTRKRVLSASSVGQVLAFSVPETTRAFSDATFAALTAGGTLRSDPYMVPRLGVPGGRK